MKRHDQQNIQTDVQRTGQNQEVQRGLAVAQGAHNARDHIVQKNKRDARKDPADVQHSPVQNIVRGLHQFQHRAGKCDRKHGKHHRQRDAQPCGVGDVAAQI